MNRSILTIELKTVGVSLHGWMPVLQCDACKHRWEPFQTAVGSSASALGPDYWKCPNNCNATAQMSLSIETIIPQQVVVNNIPGIIFGDDDLVEFERYAHSMDVTQVPNRKM